MNWLARANRQSAIKQALTRLERAPVHLTESHLYTYLGARLKKEMPAPDFLVHQGSARVPLWRRTTILDALRRRVKA